MTKQTQPYQSTVNEIGLTATSTPPSPKGRVRGVGGSGNTTNSRSNPSRMSGKEGGEVANGIGSGERGTRGGGSSVSSNPWMSGRSVGVVVVW